MVIEWLRFQVNPELREVFIQRDEEIWTEGLKKYAGYLGKEVWIEPYSNDVIIMIRWENMDVWQSVPKFEINRRKQLMGNLDIPVSESRVYQVRRFLHI